MFRFIVHGHNGLTLASQPLPSYIAASRELDSLVFLGSRFTGGHIEEWLGDEEDYQDYDSDSRWVCTDD